MDGVIGQFLILFTTIDPVGTLVLFVGLTAKIAPRQRTRVACRATGYAAVILVAFVLVGQVFLDSLGIHLASFQLAGGIIFFLFGLQMVFGTGAAAPAGESESGHDVAIFPIAVPSMASPGAILAAVVLTDNRQFTVGQQAVTVGLLILVLGLTLGVLLLANRVHRILGNAGASLIVRVQGLILAAIAVEMAFDACRELVPLLAA